MVNYLQFADVIDLLTKSGTEQQDVVMEVDETSRKFSPY